MALLRDIIYKPGPKLSKLIKFETDLINLKPLQKLTIKFDPFRNDTDEIRKFSFLIHSKNVIKTNPKCLIKTEILTDQSEQTVTFDLENNEKIILKCANLRCLEIFKLMNEHITPLAPPKTDETPTLVQKSKLRKKK